MGISPEFRTRSIDICDEFNAYVSHGEYFVRPETITLTDETARVMPAKKAIRQIILGHIDYLRKHGMRISCSIPYGSLFQPSSPGIRNPNRCGNTSDADAFLLFQTERYPDTFDRKFIKPKNYGFIYHTELTLPPNPWLRDLSITGITPKYARHSLHEFQELVEQAFQGIEHIHIPQSDIEAENPPIPIHHAIEKRRWLLDVIRQPVLSGNIPAWLIQAATPAQTTYDAYLKRRE